jgi:putative flippase GtrA
MTERWNGALRMRWLRFVIVGSVNTSFSYGVYALLLWAGLPFILANLGSLVLGILFSFRTQGRLVFGSRDNRRFFHFVVCWGMIWVVNILLIAGLIQLGFDAYLAGLLALLPVTALSYLVQKLIVFAGTPGLAPRPPSP